MTAALPMRAARLLAEAQRHLTQDRLADAARALTAAGALAPRHPALLRLRGLLELARGEPAAAVASLHAAAEQLAADAPLLDQLARAQAAAGDSESAFATWRRACAELPDSALAWFNLASQLNAHADIAAALEPLQRCVALAPDNRVARVMLGDLLAQLGRTDAAAAQYREVLRTRPDTGHAWWGLANLKTHRFDAADLAAMTAALRRHDLAEHHRAVLGFALGSAHEQRGDYAAAAATLLDANARMRRIAPWSASAFRTAMQRVRDAFATPPVGAAAHDLGHEVIFIVSLPRAGSTLVEQILAAHSQVEGAGELADLEAVIRAESSRRRLDFPDWVASANVADWQRLGETYLARTARWRTHKPRSTDKMPGNWIFIGALRAMLPGARVIDCRRDPLETAWSCFKQVFASGHAFSYDLHDIAEYWKVYDETLHFWTHLHPGRLREQHLEALIAHPEAQIRELLAFLDLPFETACVDFQQAERAVRTPSAAQVRQPLRAGSARASHYGELLDPLRVALHATEKQAHRS